VISDVVMPSMGGIELYHTLREAGSAVRFLLASGYPGRQAPAGTELDPSVPFIKKPWRMGKLLDKVREVLDETA
jgi:FixJ family two-component response regulator